MRHHRPAFQLMCYPRTGMAESMDGMRRLLDSAGARITDIRPFSDKQIVFRVSVQLDEWADFCRTLLDSSLNFSGQEFTSDVAALADSDGELSGTVTCAMRGSDPDRVDIIPDVPG